MFKPELRVKVELHCKFDPSRTFLDRRLAEVCVLLSKGVPVRRILHELQSQVASVGERIERVVQKVVSVDPELQALGLEILKFLKIAMSQSKYAGP